MKIDAWMPFFGDDFSSAVRMFPKHIKWIYLDCLWHYWSHTHCSGLPNDDVLLRELCSCDLQDWVRVKGLIFDDDRFFVLQDGKWHQMRCQEEYKKAGGISESRSESGKKGAAARWQTDGKPMANDIAKPLQNDAQPQPQPQPQETATTDNHFIPTMESCEKWLADWKKNGADYTVKEMHSAELALRASGWMWGKNPVTDFRAALERQIQTDRQRNQKTNYGNNSPKPNPRNLGTGIDAAEVGRQAAALVKRKQAEREAAARQPLAAKMVKP